MRLTRWGKLLRNVLLSCLLLLLLWAQLDFGPLTVGGMCREMGKQWLTTAPEPILVEKGKRSPYSNSRDCLVIGKSGEAHCAFRYERYPGELWQRSHYLSPRLSREPFLVPQGGRLYLVGNFPAEAAGVEGFATVQRVHLYHDLEGNREPPTFGESRDFPLSGEWVQEGIFSIPYTSEESLSSLFPREEDMDLGYAAREWCTASLRGQETEGHSILHVKIPFTLTLLTKAGEPLETLSLSVDNYELFHS